MNTATPRTDHPPSAWQPPLHPCRGLPLPREPPAGRARRPGRSRAGGARTAGGLRSSRQEGRALQSLPGPITQQAAPLPQMQPRPPHTALPPRSHAPHAAPPPGNPSHSATPTFSQPRPHSAPPTSYCPAPHAPTLSPAPLSPSPRRSPAHTLSQPLPHSAPPTSYCPAPTPLHSAPPPGAAPPTHSAPPHAAPPTLSPAPTQSAPPTHTEPLAGSMATLVLQEHPLTAQVNHTALLLSSLRGDRGHRQPQLPSGWQHAWALQPPAASASALTPAAVSPPARSRGGRPIWQGRPPAAPRPCWAPAGPSPCTVHEQSLSRHRSAPPARRQARGQAPGPPRWTAAQGARRTPCHRISVSTAAGNHTSVLRTKLRVNSPAIWLR